MGTSSESTRIVEVLISALKEEKRVTIAFVVEDERVLVLRVFNGGQSWEKTIAS